jgi:L-lactate utilization protein LutB
MQMNYEKWLWEKSAERVVKNLKKHGFDAHFVDGMKAAGNCVLDMVSSFDTIGLGGSETTRSLGILETLEAAGKTIFDHWQEGLTREQDLEIRLQQGRCQCFLCSANAIAATGEIVNVDGIGNRTNAMSFGVDKVIIVAGMNKVRPDLDSALRRVSEIAAPMRAKSLGMETPCAETGMCTDCNAPQRICRITTILHRKPMLTDVSVILVNRAVGF